MDHYVLPHTVHGHLTVIDCGATTTPKLIKPPKRYGFNRHQRVLTMEIKLLLLEASYIARSNDNVLTRIKRTTMKRFINPGVLLAYTGYVYLKYRK